MQCEGENRFRRLCQPFLYSHSSSHVLEVEVHSPFCVIYHPIEAAGFFCFEIYPFVLLPSYNLLLHSFHFLWFLSFYIVPILSFLDFFALTLNWRNCSEA